MKCIARRAAAGALLAALGTLVACGGPVDTGSAPIAQPEQQAHTTITLRPEDPPMSAELTHGAQLADADNDDAQIVMKVNEALDRDADLGGMKIDVDSQDGAVTLRGRAPDPDARDRASQIVRGLRSVKSVENLLTLG